MQPPPAAHLHCLIMPAEQVVGVKITMFEVTYFPGDCLPLFFADIHDIKSDDPCLSTAEPVDCQLSYSADNFNW